MTLVPDEPKIYHITHVDNLDRIIADGELVCDRAVLERGGAKQTIGMSAIKRRRLETLEVPCHPGTKVGDCVPFYFCPRSVMLYVISMANHQDLQYRGGQGPIVHLEADLQRVVDWADDNGVRWAFSLSNAGASYTEFRNHMEQLTELDWTAIQSNDFRQPEVKERKQSEFLVHGRFPIDLIERVGVRSSGVRTQAAQAFSVMAQRPAIEIRGDWYF